MTEAAWTDRIVGERMTVDREFASRVDDSRFSNQEWSLIMTATEFEIENPDDPEEARLVANTEKIDQILPELETLRSQMGGMGGPQPDDRGSSGSLVGTIKGALGLGTGTDDYEDERAEAEVLTTAYAEELQAELESNARWDAVCTVASES